MNLISSILESRTVLRSLRIFQHYFDERSGDGLLVLGHFFGGSLGDDLAPCGACFGAEVDDVVGFRREVHVVLDDDDCVALVDEAVEDVSETGDVLLVESNGGLFDEIEIRIDGAKVSDLGSTFGQLRDEFEPLCFAAGNSGAGLAEGEVAEASFGEKGEGFLKLGVGVEELGRGFDVEIEDVSNAQAVVADFESGGIVAVAVTGFAIDPSRWQEVHLELDTSVALTLGALAFFVIEGEAGGGVATYARFGKLGIEGADVVEEFDVSGGAGTGGFADGSLVDFVAILERIETACFLIGKSEGLR